MSNTNNTPCGCRRNSADGTHKRETGARIEFGRVAPGTVVLTSTGFEARDEEGRRLVVAAPWQGPKLPKFELEVGDRRECCAERVVHSLGLLGGVRSVFQGLHRVR